MVTFDEINYWSEIKIDIIKEYAAIYSIILTKQIAPRFHHVYIDAFSGSGKHYSKRTQDFVLGTSLSALDIEPRFKEYYFIDIDKEKVQALKNSLENIPYAHALEGDCNVILLEKVFPKIKHEQLRRGLCILDPYGLDLNWEVMQKAGQMKSMEIFVNFPVMDIHRNVLWQKPNGVLETNLKRMNAFWGDESWKNVAYREVKDLFGEVHQKKEHIKVVAQAFRRRLQEVAGFAYVPEPIPMRNSNRSIVYYLFFASQKPVAERIVLSIFNKYRGWC